MVDERKTSGLLPRCIMHTYSESVVSVVTLASQTINPTTFKLPWLTWENVMAPKACGDCPSL